MLKKDLRSKRFKGKPQLAFHYEVASDEIFDSPVFVGAEHFKRFKRVEKDLSKLGIFPKDYAYGLLKHLRSWVYGKGWERLPINVFCGSWAIDLYKREVAPVKFVDTPQEEIDRGMLLHDELLVARYYIDSSGEMTMDEVIEKLTPILSESWLDVCANNRRLEVVSIALEVLSTERGKPLDHYSDFI